MNDLVLALAVVFGLASIGSGIRDGLYRIAEIMNLRWR
jgi:hypothetical protein